MLPPPCALPRPPTPHRAILTHAAGDALSEKEG
jgi:hypothetical protein